MSRLLLTITAAVGLVIMGAGFGFAAHPDIPLYTYEEVAQQFGQPMMPVALDGEMKGFPYSPKQTCRNCHNGGLTSNDGQYTFTEALVSYADMDNDTFHVQQDANAMVENVGESAQAGKPWTQSLGMAGKW